MNFLCDVHIAYKIKRFLISQGHLAIHVNELPQSSETPDCQICSHADANNFIVITKDADFVDWYFIKQSPQRLIKINLGNIATGELINLLASLLPQLSKLLSRSHFLIEIDRDGSINIDQTVFS